MILWGAGLLLVLAALSGATAWYMLGVPGKSFAGPVPPPTRPEEDLAGRLKRHVTAIASVPHNISHYAELEKSAAYIEGELKALGYQPQAQVFDTDGRSVRNIEVTLEPKGAGPETESLVVGAHYDQRRHCARRQRQRHRGRRRHRARAPLEGRDAQGQAPAPRALRQRGAALRPHAQHGQLALCEDAQGARRARRRHDVAGDARLLLRQARQPEISRALRPLLSLEGQLHRLRRAAGIARASCKR